MTNDGSPQSSARRSSGSSPARCAGPTPNNPSTNSPGWPTPPGAAVVVRALQERPTPDSATFIGRGKAQALALACAEAHVDVVIVDNELTPAQLRELQDLVGCKVVDRTQLILDIFARRARTREGKLQVELAQLQYLLPRLVGASTRALAPRRRHRHAGSWRDQARDGPPQASARASR